MRSLLLILGREFRAYWTSPIAYVVISILALLSGLLFFAELNQFRTIVISTGGAGVDVNQQLIRPYLHSVSVMILFFVPLVTMRLFAEERRQGTLEVLLTTPTPELAIVSGKFLSAFSLLLVMLAIPAAHVGLLYGFGKPDAGPILTGFLGLILSGAVYVAVGLFFSALTQNQVVAAAVSFAFFLLLWLLEWIGSSAPGMAGDVLGYVSLGRHFENFGRGVLDTSDLVFYFSWIAAGLYAATQAVLSTRWKA